jgi:hypothetical protein
MPFTRSFTPGAPPLSRRLVALISAVLLLSGTGCIVTRTAYENKAREADELREAMASVNRERALMAERNSALEGQLATGKQNEALLASRVTELEGSPDRLGEGLPGERRKVDGNRITRERFVDELLEREKATGRKLQDLSSRSEACETDLARTRRETADRNREISALKGRLAALVAQGDELQRERSILSGRVERLREERRDAARSRDRKFEGLAADLGRISREIDVTPLGSALHIVMPEKLVVRERGQRLTRLGETILTKVSGTVSEIPSASLLVVAGGKTVAETFRSAAGRGGVPKARIFSRVREKSTAAEFLLITE